MSQLVRQHLSQHDAAEQLPLVTDEAVVTDVTYRDRDRREEVVEATASLLHDYGRSEWVETEGDEVTGVDWDAIDQFVETGADGESHLAEHLKTLSGRYSRPHPSLLSFRFHAEDVDFEYAPGQYAAVRFERTPRAYSLANSPNEDETEVCVRRVPGGRLTTKLFTDLAEGDEITIRGPAGEFVLQEPSHRDMVFIATGTGVAPLKAMIDYTFEEGRDEFEGQTRDVWLVLGSSWEDDLPYHEDWKRYDDERENFHYVPTLSRENVLTDWEGETEYVQRTFLKYFEDGSVEASALDESLRQFLDEEPAYDVDARIHPEHLEVYACGINAMVFPLVDVVQSAGVPDECIESEGYG